MARQSIDNVGFGSRRMGIQRSLIAPGVSPQFPQAPAPPSPGTRSQIMLLLQGAAGLGGTATQFATTTRRIREEQQAISDIEIFENDVATATKDSAVPEVKTAGVREALHKHRARLILETFDLNAYRLPGETVPEAGARFMRQNMPADSPIGVRAFVRQGISARISAETTRQARLAQAKVLDDTAANIEDAAYEGDLEGTQKAIAAREPFAKAVQTSEDERASHAIRGATRAANQGFEQRVRDIAPLLKPKDADRLIRVARGNRQTQTSNQIRDEEITAIDEGTSFNESWTRVKKRIETPGKPRPDDITRGHSMALNNILQGRALEKAENEFWTDVRYGKIETPEEAVAKIRENEKLGNFKPKQAATLEQQFKQGKQHSARVDYVKEVRAGRPAPPLPAGLDNALLTTQLEDGLITAITEKNGTNPVFTGVVRGRQKQWALDYAKVSRIPTKVATHIDTLLTNTKTENVGQGLGLFVALHAFAPNQADAVYESMDATSQMRASAALDALADVPLEAMTEGQRNQAISDIMPDIMDLKLSATTDKEAEALIFLDADPAAFVDDIMQKPLPDDIRIIEKGWLYDSKRTIETVPKVMVDEFRSVATRVYRANEHLGTEIAASRAEEAGKRAALRLGKPTIWDARVVWVVDGPDTTQETGNTIFRDLRQWFSEEEAKAIAKTYRITWSPGHGGYVLADEVNTPKGELLQHMRGGVPKVFVSGGRVIPKGAGIEPPRLIAKNEQPAPDIIPPTPEPKWPTSNSRIQKVIAGARNGRKDAQDWLITNGYSPDLWEK